MPDDLIDNYPHDTPDNGHPDLQARYVREAQENDSYPPCPRCGSPRLHKMGWACGTSGTPDNFGSTPACQRIARMRDEVADLRAERDERADERDIVAGILGELVDALRWHNADTYDRELPDWREYERWVPDVSPIDGHVYLESGHA